MTILTQTFKKGSLITVILKQLRIALLTDEGARALVKCRSLTDSLDYRRAGYKKNFASSAAILAHSLFPELGIAKHCLKLLLQ